MRSQLLKFSLCLNLVLLATAAYWAATKKTEPAPPRINDTAEAPPKTAANDEVTAIRSALRWSDLESQDYPTYVANLRKTGCPEPVLRRIINADLKDLYAKKAFALVREFHRDFWEIAAKQNVQQFYEKTLAPQVKAFCSEPDTILNQLLGEAPAEPTNPRTPNPPDTLISSDESAESRLRQSSAAKEVQGLYGVDFSETELRNIAKVLDDYHHRTDSQADAETETLDQKLEAALGPARFKDFDRSRSASYRQIYEVVTDFGKPAEAAAEIFDLRQKCEKQSEDIRSDRNRSAEEKQALLDDLQEQVEQSIRSKMGAAAYHSYKTGNGGWINALGRL